MAKLKKILYVEDEQDIQLVAKLALKNVAGFDVLACSSGKEALSKVVDFAPDLIVLDAMMPGMDGPTTFLELKKMDAVERVPIIFLTAKAQATEIDRFLEMGAIAVLTKPFDPMTLGKSLEKLFDDHMAKNKNNPSGKGLFM